MTFPLKWLALPLACLSVLPAAAGGAATSVTPAERDAVVATATQAAAAQLKIDAARLRLVPEHLKRRGDWVLLTAALHDPDGQRFDYAGTPLHAAAQGGGVSSLCAALLRREGAGWKLIDIAVGPTDVAWAGWAARHQAPAALFE